MEENKFSKKSFSQMNRFGKKITWKPFFSWEKNGRRYRREAVEDCFYVKKTNSLLKNMLLRPIVEKVEAIREDEGHQIGIIIVCRGK
jgi:hypothetical protein